MLPKKRPKKTSNEYGNYFLINLLFQLFYLINLIYFLETSDKPISKRGGKGGAKGGGRGGKKLNTRGNTAREQGDFLL